MSIQVNITGTGSSIGCYVKIAGTKYYSAKTLEIEAGTEILIAGSGVLQKVILNGETVSTGNSYSFVPDCSVVNIKLVKYTANIGTTVYRAEITTESGFGGGHSVLVDGTAYAITIGKVMVDGTVYDITKGRALIDGTGYDIK